MSGGNVSVPAVPTSLCSPIARDAEYAVFSQVSRVFPRDFLHS
jgi:hypothetical protein